MDMTPARESLRDKNQIQHNTGSEERLPSQVLTMDENSAVHGLIPTLNVKQINTELDTVALLTAESCAMCH